MGGIPTDNDGRVLGDGIRTPVVGFYAAGECACVSVHGANRLGTNSLLDASVFGRRAGAAMADFVLDGAALAPLPPAAQARALGRLRHYQEGERTESVDAVGQELKTTMTEDCGVFRDGAGLSRARQAVGELQRRYRGARIMDRSRRFNTDLLSALETEHLLTFSEVIVAGAEARTESRGAHFRTDFPKRNDENWLQHTLAFRALPGEPPRLEYRPVRIDWDKYPPQERKY
jgi:succinate dehydrogenase / fumarate reductase flavoprotein subunit